MLDGSNQLIDMRNELLDRRTILQQMNGSLLLRHLQHFLDARAHLLIPFKTHLP